MNARIEKTGAYARIIDARVTRMGARIIIIRAYTIIMDARIKKKRARLQKKRPLGDRTP